MWQAGLTLHEQDFRLCWRRAVSWREAQDIRLRAERGSHRGHSSRISEDLWNSRTDLGGCLDLLLREERAFPKKKQADSLPWALQNNEGRLVSTAARNQRRSLSILARQGHHEEYFQWLSWQVPSSLWEQIVVKWSELIQKVSGVQARPERGARELLHLRELLCWMRHERDAEVEASAVLLHGQ